MPKRRKKELDALKVEQVKNFWRKKRSVEDAARALDLPEGWVEILYEAMNQWRETFKKTAPVLGLVLVLVTGAHAQTISPVVVEAGARGNPPRVNGSFTVSNDGLTPLAVIVESPKSFSGCNGQPCDMRPLDAGVSLKLSETSARIPPRARWQFSYRLTCPGWCAVMLDVTVTGVKAPRAGLAVRLHLPHVIYACPKVKGCRRTLLAGPTATLRLFRDAPDGRCQLITVPVAVLERALRDVTPVGVWP